jgi:hypothetical protein
MCRGKKIEDREIGRNSSRKWKLKKRVQNNSKDLPRTIHRQGDKTLKVDQFMHLVRCAKNKKYIVTKV